MPPSDKSKENTFASRVDLLAKEAGGARALSRLAGVSETMVRKWAGGADATRESLVALATATKVSLEWLATGEGQMRGARKFDFPGWHRVTAYDVRASAGGGSAVSEERGLGMLISDDDVQKLGIRPVDLTVIFATGDSMEPTIQKGDQLLIDKSESGRSPRDGGIFVIRQADDLVVKRLQREPDGGLRLLSDNKHYEPSVIPPERLESVQIIGRVLWSGHWREPT